MSTPYSKSKKKNKNNIMSPSPDASLTKKSPIKSNNKPIIQQPTTEKSIPKQNRQQMLSKEKNKKRELIK
jgi:hypothetical protein